MGKDALTKEKTGAGVVAFDLETFVRRRVDKDKVALLEQELQGLENIEQADVESLEKKYLTPEAVAELETTLNASSPPSEKKKAGVEAGEDPKTPCVEAGEDPKTPGGKEWDFAGLPSDDAIEVAVP